MVSVLMAPPDVAVPMASVPMVVVVVAVPIASLVVVVSVAGAEVVAGVVVSSVVSSFLQPAKLSKPTSKHVNDWIEDDRAMQL
jgi:hypothetical protein